MRTVLDVLARDGSCYMAFSPRLSVKHYGELLAITTNDSTCEEMQAAVAVWAKERGIRYSFDEAKEPSDS